MPFKRFCFIWLFFSLLAFVFLFNKIVYSDVEAPGQELSVSVGPGVSDLSVDISAALENVNQNTEITYTITYGSNLTYSTSLTLEAEWSLGTPEGTYVSDTEIADYIIGSAEDAYGSTPAVIDLVNRKISWTISSFPAQTTDETVTFKLRTNANYTGTKKIKYTVYARITSGSLIVTDQLDNNYQFKSISSTLTPTPTPTPTTTPSLLPLIFNNVSIASLLSDQATINFTLSEASKLKVSYGTAQNTLANTIQSLEYLKDQQIQLIELKPETRYYFLATATSISGQTARSDIFTFKTPPVSIVPQPEPNSLVITSNNIILASPTIFAEEKKAIPSVVLPEESLYEFRFEIKNYQTIKKVEAVFRNKYVLGLNFPNLAESSTKTTTPIQVSPGVFEGRLKAAEESGRYEIVVRIFDMQGNIAEKKVADVKVVKSLTVLRDGDPKIAVEGARILIKKFDQLANDYEVLSPVSFAIENPSYTQASGEDRIVLPAGRYKADVRAIGYLPKEVEFVLGDKTGQDYPTVYLKHKFSLLSFANYIWVSFIDFMDISKLYLTTIGSSNRFFELNATSTLLVTLIIIFLGLSFHTKIPINKIHSYFLNLFRKRSKKFVSKNIFGKVLNYETNLPESRAVVYLVDGIKKEVIYSTKTNKLGEFNFRRPEIEDYKFWVMKQGFEDLFVEEFAKEKLNNLVFNIKEKIRIRSLKAFLKEVVELLSALIIPGLIVICLVVEFALGYSFGFLKVLPFMIISAFNAFLWAKFYHPVFKNI